MKHRPMDDSGPELTEADRRAIGEIRRKLDAEYRQRLDDEFGPVDEREGPHPGEATTKRGAALSVRVAWRPGRIAQWAAHRVGRRTAIVTAFLLGLVAGGVLGTIATAVRDGGADRTTVRSDTRASEPSVETREDVEAPVPRAGGDAAMTRAPATNGAAAATPPAVDEAALLRDALGEWIEATRRGDIPAQMRFYPARVPVYYRQRNVPREAVRAEKVKVFGAARRLDITTDAPAVVIDQDRRTAITRFRKRYVIEGPAIRRRGEVVQELRWSRTPNGWVIVSERDARVLRSG